MKKRIAILTVFIMVMGVICFGGTATAATAQLTFYYGDVELSEWNSGNFAQIWDLTQCDLTFSYTIDLSGQTSGGWTPVQVGFREIGKANLDPNGFGGWMTSIWQYPATDPNLADQDDHFLLVDHGWASDELDYDVDENGDIVSPFGSYDSYAFWFDRDGVDQWQETYWNYKDGITYNTNGVYDVVITYHSVNSTISTMMAMINGEDQGFYLDGYTSDNPPDTIPVGKSFSGDMTKMQVFYGRGGGGGTVALSDIEVTGCMVLDEDGMVTGGGWIDSPAGAMPPTTSNVTVSGISGDTSIDPDAANAEYYLRYVGNPPPAGYDPYHNYQWGSPAIFTPSPEDGPVILQGTIDVDEQKVGQVAMIGLLDADDLAAGNSSFQRGAYIYIYRSSATAWKIGPSDGNSGGEIVQTFVTIADTELPSNGILNVTFTVDGTSDGTACAVGPYTTPAGCMTLQITGGSVNATLTDSYGDVIGDNSASPEFANGAVLGWDDYLGSNVGYTLTVPSMTSGSPEGKATFGFVSKYKKGASTPTGQTEFYFKAGDLNFHSDSYDWMVVAGAKAMYKGVGTINGEGEYKFMLTAIDADIKDTDAFDIDRFRIKIWYEFEDTEYVVYDNALGDDNDNATTEISGGSIVIHNKK